MRLLALALWMINLALAMKRRLGDDDIQRSRVIIQTEYGDRILFGINKNESEHPEYGQKQTLDEFFRENLCGEFIDIERLKPILVFLEKWLSSRDGPPSSFNAHLKFYDSSMSPETQGGAADTFRTRSILKLVKFAQKLGLYTLWAAAI